jgi:hypothetical protein
MVGLVVLALLAILLDTAGLFAYHWSSGATPRDAMEMVVEDFRVAVRCPGKPSAIRDFVSRSPLAPGIRPADVIGEVWVERVCEGMPLGI